MNDACGPCRQMSEMHRYGRACIVLVHRMVIKNECGDACAVVRKYSFLKRLPMMDVTIYL